MRVFNREFGGLHQAAFLLGVFALLSQILALVRDRLFAHFFGASSTLDIYYAAFRIPDFLFVSIASLVSLSVLIPWLTKKIEAEDESAARFVNHIFTVFFSVIVVVSAVMFFIAPLLLPFLFPGFSASQTETLVMITRILLLSPILLGISNLLGSVTQTFKRFFVYAMSPVLYNVGIIFGILVLYPMWGIAGLAWGVIIGAFLHLAIQIPVVRKLRLLPRPATRIDWEEMKSVVLLSLPRTLGLSAQHIALLVLVGLGSVLGEGAITVFNLSFNLQSVPLAIIGVSYSVAAFPTLAGLYAQSKNAAFAEKIVTTARHILFWALPVLVLFIVLRAQIVRTVLGSGAFDWAETRLTAAALALFVVSLVAQAFVLVFVRGYYAAGKTKIPVLVNVGGALLAIGAAYGLLHVFNTSIFFKEFIESLLRVDGIAGTAVLMLPLAYSIGMIANAGALVIMFARDFGAFHTHMLGKAFFDSFAGAVVMGFVAYQFLQVFAHLFDLSTFLGIFLQGLFSGLLGIVIGLMVLKSVRSVELQEVQNSLHTRFWKSKPVAPEKEEL